MPFDQFVQMVVYTPPGTAVYYFTHEGWDRNTHKLTQLVEAANWLVWAKSEAAERDPHSPPPPEWRPGDPIPEQKPVMTIGQYMERAGLTDEDLYGGSMR